MMEEKTELPVSGGKVFQADFLYVDIFPVIDEVLALKGYDQSFVAGADLGDQAFRAIFRTESPILGDPVELPIHSDPEAEFVAPGVIFLAHIGIIEIPQAVILIETNQQVPVADRNVTGHGTVFPFTLSSSQSPHGNGQFGIRASKRNGKERQRRGR
jgi:hypothetical protein